MPPFTGWYQGPEAIGRLVAFQCPASGPGDMRMVPTSANGQPAFGMYMRRPDGSYEPFQLHVLSVGAGGVSHAAVFFDLSLFPSFGLPAHLPARPEPAGE
jgi:RNA polymerase sigma-70 factor, ECF subfamily